MPKTFVLHDESINSYGFWMKTSGGDLSQFIKNPIMLFMHNRAWRGTEEDMLPIGHWENLRVVGEQILAEPVFDDDEFSQKIAKKVESGTLKMASVGVKAIETSSDIIYYKPGQTYETVTKWKLKEASIVDMGSNDNACCLYDDDDKIITLSDTPGKEIPIKKLSINPNNESMKKVLLGLKLAEGVNEAANEDAVLQHVQLKDDQIISLTTERDAFRTKLSDHESRESAARQAEAITLVDEAVKQGKIDASGKDSFLALFAKDHEGAKIALAAIPKRTSISGQLGNTGSDTEREQLEKLSWDEADRSGKLLTLKDKYFDLYESKFEKQFGTKPRKKDQ